MLLDFNRPAQTLRKFWNLLRGVPFGKLIFSRILGLCIPYTGSVSPVVEELEPGLVRLRMADRRSVRNHLRSVHAVALVNLGEAATGLGVTLGLPDDKRAIVTEIKIKYLKKARGSLQAVCRFELPPRFTEGELEVPAQIEDGSGQIVAEILVTWMVSPSKLK